MKDKVVIVTGASSGIGLALINDFLRLGSKVVMAARSEDIMLKEKKELEKTYPDKIIVQKTDVTREEDCKQLIAKTIENFGKIDILINNAGISMRGCFIETDLIVLKKLMDVNFWGAVYCTKYALPHLLKTQGALVAVSSIAGFHGLPCRTAYSASKFAMNGFFETLRIENLKNGLHVMVVSPWFTSSNIRKSALGPDGNPQLISPRKENKMMQPEEVSKIIIRGLKRKRRNIIVSWKGKISVLLQRVIPKQLDKIFYYEMAKEPNSPLKKL